jgi:hypothetical protein
MKLLCLILSFYVAFLSTTPCCTDDKCNDDIDTEQTNHHSEESKDCNSCSPFFTCGACSGFVFSNAGFYFGEVTFVLKEFVSVYNTQFLDEFVTKIWQPPKLN